MKIIASVILLSIFSIGFSQSSKTLKDFGVAYEINDADFAVDLNQEFKAVFDVASISDSKTKINRKFETLARYLRLHKSPQLENNSVKAALVIHGSAVFDLLSHDEYANYHKQADLKNPNYDLLSVLAENDVDIILCGQTSVHRSIDKSKLHPDVKIALSAMTALIHLQNEGYQLIKF